MKTAFFDEIAKNLNGYQIGKEIVLLGWIKSIRKSKELCFFDVVDSTATLQVVGKTELIEEKSLKKEQSVKIICNVKLSSNGVKELWIENFYIIGDVKNNMRPNPRQEFSIFEPRYTDYVQKNRHLFVRNPKVMAVLKARDYVKQAVQRWFCDNRFTEITAPILTPVLLYDESTGIPVRVRDQDLYLTQCVAFYLESAVHAFERVYNIGPSFRGAESVSPRHLTEYWHVKAEWAFVEFEDMFAIVEDLISSVAKELKDNCKNVEDILGVTPVYEEALKIPYPRITYRDAVELCRANGFSSKFGESLNSKEEDFITTRFGSPVWITYNPKSIEGFPYKTCDFDDELTYTADLIGSSGGGEVLGIADKITDYNELERRLEEHGKNNGDYEWYKELRNYGEVPHCGMGMGLERLIKWLFKLSHVREAIPFPRSMGRKIYP